MLIMVDKIQGTLLTAMRNFRCLHDSPVLIILHMRRECEMNLERPSDAKTALVNKILNRKIANPKLLQRK